MKVSKEKAAQNRAALVETAARLIRERGIDGVGVAEIGKAAGLTHGALYAHFPSKEALAAEALAYGLDRGHRSMTETRNGCVPGLSELLDGYLSEEKRNDLADGCAMAASASEIGRQDATISARYSEGLEKMVDVFEGHLRSRAAGGEAGASGTSGAAGASNAVGNDGDAREKALAIATAMIGGIAASRAVLKARPDLANEILRSVRRAVGEIAGEVA